MGFQKYVLFIIGALFHPVKRRFHSFGSEIPLIFVQSIRAGRRNPVDFSEIMRYTINSKEDYHMDAGGPFMPWFARFDDLISRRFPDCEVLCEEPMDRHTTFRIGGPARRCCLWRRRRAGPSWS